MDSRSRNGHDPVSIRAVMWHNAFVQQIMAKGALEDVAATMRSARIPHPATEVADFVGAQQEEPQHDDDLGSRPGFMWPEVGPNSRYSAGLSHRPSPLPFGSGSGRAAQCCAAAQGAGIRDCLVAGPSS